MPSALLARGEQEVDRRERRTLGAAVNRSHAKLRAEDLGEVAALGVGCEVERPDEVGGSFVHDPAGGTISLGARARA